MPPKFKDFTHFYFEKINFKLYVENCLNGPEHFEEIHNSINALFLLQKITQSRKIGQKDKNRKLKFFSYFLLHLFLF